MNIVVGKSNRTGMETIGSKNSVYNVNNNNTDEDGNHKQECHKLLLNCCCNQQ